MAAFPLLRWSLWMLLSALLVSVLCLQQTAASSHCPSSAGRVVTKDQRTKAQGMVCHSCEDSSQFSVRTLAYHNHAEAATVSTSQHVSAQLCAVSLRVAAFSC